MRRTLEGERRQAFAPQSNDDRHQARPTVLGSLSVALRWVGPLQANFVIDLNAMVFAMPRALFPAIGTEILGGDTFAVGLLFVAPGIGALVAALTLFGLPM